MTDTDKGASDERGVGHTPGPWNLGGTNGDGVTSIIARYDHASEGFPVVADVPPRSNGDDAANARLIAAAPDLLSALEKAAERFETVRARIYRLGVRPGTAALELADYTRQCEAEIDAAIARARGTA